jgi:hypothetical protein
MIGDALDRVGRHLAPGGVEGFLSRLRHIDDSRTR